MDPGQQPESSKRPRLSTAAGSWASGAPHGTLSLPPPMSSGPQHSAPPRSYQNPFPRASEPLPPPQPHQASPLHTPRPGQHHQLPDDRRHHDHDHFTPMQDFRQPPPSPAHVAQPQLGAPPPNTFPATYPTREPTIKRDSADEQHISAPIRPQSTGSGPESQSLHPPPMNPVSHPPPHPSSTAPPVGPHSAYPDGPRRHMSFDAGPPLPETPGAYGGRTPNYPPPGPAPHQHPYDPMYSNDPYYGGVPYTSSSKKRTSRASQACDSCRALKAKCDETKPCKNCREKNIDCKYREPAPKPTDKAQADILDGVQKVAELLDKSIADQRDFQRKIDNRIKRLESALLQLNPKIGLKEEAVSDDDEPILLPEDRRMAGPSDDAYPDPTHPPMYDVADEEVEVEPGPPVFIGQPSIPTNHTTGAGYLLTWPCINDLLYEALDKENIKFPTEFPIGLEEQRGILRVYGRGEGQDPARGDRDPRTVHGSAEMADDPYLDFNSPTPGDSSGYIGGFSPGSVSDYPTSSPRPPLLNQSGIPDFSEETVNAHVKSFEENILLMHPIILPHHLWKMVQIFLDSIPKPSKSFPAQTASFVVPPSPQPSSAFEMAGTKRKRSPGAEVPDTPQFQHRIGRPTRTINNAVVLVILALGKICQKREMVPDVVYDDEPLRNGHPSSPHPSSPESCTPSATHYSTMMSPKTSERSILGRRPSTQGNRGSRARRNYDAIPGLEYFAIATDIIGNQMGGNTLNHVYANIFAGLYHGQLGRVVESHAYIAHGCTVLMNILRPRVKRLEKYTLPVISTAALDNQDPAKSVRGHQDTERPPLTVRDNQLLFAFWTCVQLESDIIAEIPRHQSGISALEEYLPYPDITRWLESWFPGKCDPDTKQHASDIIESYTAQLYLRKHLNPIHRMVYSDNNSNVDPRSILHKVNDAQSRVGNMAWVGPAYKFNEDDKPAKDILSARLRAKYWGAQVITYRPCIKLILDLSFDLRRRDAGSAGQMAQTLEELSEDVKNEVSMLGPEVWKHAQKGVRALVESTQAFHGLGKKRPIITNVFGTAHAQWGNILALSACYRDPFLRQEIEGETLKNLFKKTMNFLRQSSTWRSALTVDQRLLESLYRKLFFESPPVPMQPNASFSSTTSGPSPGQPHPSPQEPGQGQGASLEPMAPPHEHGGTVMTPRIPVGTLPPGPAQGDVIEPVQGTPMLPSPIGGAPMGPPQSAMAPPHQPNMMQ